MLKKMKIKSGKKAPFADDEIRVGKFQMWYNQQEEYSGSLAVDGIWGKYTQAAWDEWQGAGQSGPGQEYKVQYNISDPVLKKGQEDLQAALNKLSNTPRKLMKESDFKEFVKKIINENKYGNTMKIKLTEETLNRYIEEAIKQEINEGVFTAGRELARKGNLAQKIGSKIKGKVKNYWHDLSGKNVRNARENYNNKLNDYVKSNGDARYAEGQIDQAREMGSELKKGAKIKYTDLSDKASRLKNNATDAQNTVDKAKAELEKALAARKKTRWGTFAGYEAIKNGGKVGNLLGGNGGDNDEYVQ